MGDKAAIMVGGWGVYRYYNNKYLKEGMSKEEANKKALTRFEIATKRTQQDRGVESLGHFQRGDDLYKLFTMFMTAPSSYSRQVMAAMRNMKASPVDSMKRLAVAHIVLPAVFQAIASAALLLDDDEDKRSDAHNDIMKAIALGGVNGIFLVRDAADYAANILTGTGYGTMELTPTNEVIKSATTTVNKAIKYAQDEADFIDIIDPFLKTTGFATGLPYEPFKRMVTGVSEAVTGETEKPIFRAVGYSKYAVGERK